MGNYFTPGDRGMFYAYLQKTKTKSKTEQVKNQTGNRLFLTLQTNDLTPDFQKLQSIVVSIVREPGFEN